MYKFLNKTCSGSEARLTITVGLNVNKVLAQELHKLVVKILQKRKVYARFKDNIWAADLPAMGPLPSKNQSVKYFLCAIDVLTRYA